MVFVPSDNDRNNDQKQGFDETHFGSLDNGWMSAPEGLVAIPSDKDQNNDQKSNKNETVVIPLDSERYSTEVPDSDNEQRSIPDEAIDIAAAGVKPRSSRRNALTRKDLL